MASYSFLTIAASLLGPGGSVILGAGSGSAEEGIEIEFAEDTNQLVVGADGTPMHSLHASKASIITINLLKTSPANAVLQQMYNFQRANPVNHGRNIFSLRDNARGDSYSARQVAFKKAPGNKFAKDANMIQWTMDAGITDFILGIGLQG